MTRAIKLRRVGGSVETTLPKEMLDRLHLTAGDRMLAVETDQGILLTPYSRRRPITTYPAKAAETERSGSGPVNAAVQQALSEDAADLAAFRERADEPALQFKESVRDLRRRGQL